MGYGDMTPSEVVRLWVGLILGVALAGPVDLLQRVVDVAAEAWYAAVGVLLDRVMP